MIRTFETAAFTAISTAAISYLITGKGKMPPVVFATFAALIQRTVSTFAKHVNKDLEKDKKNQTFIKTFNYSAAALFAYAISKPLIELGTKNPFEEPLSAAEPAPTNPLAYTLVGVGTFGATNSFFDYASPAKIFSAIAEFPSKKLPLGKYFISFVATYLAVDQLAKQILPKEGETPLSSETIDTYNTLQFAAAAGILVAIVLSDIFFPPEQTEKKPPFGNQTLDRK